MKIGLDAGHGLKTAGKQTPDKIKEWTLNDKVRDKEVAILKDYNVEIIHTDNDEGNVDEGLTSRRVMYVNQKVDVFVSNHHNAFKGKWGKHTGVSVYIDKNHTEEDLKLAEAIYKRLVKYTGLKGRGILKANFTVINQNHVPACLVEGGFMDSTIDYPVITSKKGQDAYARAVAEGLIEFLDLKKKESVSQQTNTSNTTFKEYTVKINSYDGELNVRAKPDDNSKVKAVVKNGEVYTIVEENNGWGKLKSGAGWIYLKYTTKTTSTNTTTTKKAYTGKFPSLGLRGYLRQGDRGTNVMRLQEFLNWCINAGLKIDGSFGDATLAAVKNYQKTYGLKIDGFFGSACLKKAKTIKK